MKKTLFLLFMPCIVFAAGYADPVDTAVDAENDNNSAPDSGISGGFLSKEAEAGLAGALITGVPLGIALNQKANALNESNLSLAAAKTAQEIAEKNSALHKAKSVVNTELLGKISAFLKEDTVKKSLAGEESPERAKRYYAAMVGFAGMGPNIPHGGKSKEDILAMGREARKAIKAINEKTIDEMGTTPLEGLPYLEKGVRV